MSAASPRTVPVTIDRNAPLPPAEDFAALKTQAVMDWLPEWCAGIWTDFNDHDPGIMILEQLIYASTELPYRANLPMPRLLRDAKGAIPWAANSLYSPIDILPMEPLTADDYARLLYDRIPSLIYASVAALPLPLPAGGVAPGIGGRLQACVAVSPDARPEAVKEALAQAGLLLARQCNLGERFESVVLQPFVFFELNITVRLAPGAAPDTVRDNLYLAARQALLPGPTFRTLARALYDETIDAALSGPLLARGVLEDADLPRLWQWSEAKVRTAQAILGATGVEAVTSIVFSNEAALLAQARVDTPQLYAPALVATVTPLAPDNSTPGTQAVYSVTLTNAPTSPPSPPAVGSADARTNPYIQTGGEDPTVQFVRLLPVSTWEMPPAAEEPSTVVEEYTSIQNTFPACFALQADSLPPDTTPLRRAQAWQLKGYLLVFEQLMANYFAQLAHTAEFFSNQPQSRTVFTQPLTSVPGVMPLLVGSEAGVLPADPTLAAAQAAAYWAEGLANPYINGLNTVAEDAAGRLKCRRRVLDHLLARFNENFPRTDRTTYETIVNRQDLLQAYPRVSVRRALAADLTSRVQPGQARPRSGLEEKMQLLLRRDTQSDPATPAGPSGPGRELVSDDFYFILETIRFLPRAGATGAGERWDVPQSAFKPGLFHVWLNWTMRPLTGAFVNYVQACVGENVPAHLWSRHIWLETHPHAGPNVARFRQLLGAWAEDGYPPLVLAPPPLATDSPPPPDTISVCRGTPAAALFAWLLDPSALPVVAAPASP